MRQFQTLTIALAILALGAITASASPLVDQRYAELKQACSPEDHPYAGKSEAEVKAALATTSDRAYKLDLAQCERDDDVADGDSNARPTPASYNQRQRGDTRYTSFANVAAGSRNVHTRGKNYKLRNIGGNTQACNPPIQLVRSERCGPTPDGRGVRCRFDCR